MLMKITNLLLAASAILLGSGAALAQSWDDDIYFDASKAKKKKTVRTEQRAASVATYPAADF